MGGGVDGGITTFGRHAATIPARRADQAVTRLIGLYQARTDKAETAVSFFRRVDLAEVKGALAGLDKIDPATASDEDFIDLAEADLFQPSVQDGECSA